jgi:O-antigen/teichoic acid export membrane protein
MRIRRPPSVSGLSLPFGPVLRGLRSSSIVRDSAWMFLAQGVRIATQAGYFILVARTLGVSEFGRLAAALALVAIAVPFAAWGSGNLLIKDVVRDRRAFPSAWGSGILMISTAGSLLVLLVTAFAALVLDQLPVQLVALVAISDLLFARFTDTCGQAFQGFGNLRTTARVLMLPGICRLVAAIAFVAGPGNTAQSWAYWYLASSIVVAALATPLVLLRLGGPAFDVARTVGRLREGFYFAVGLSSETVYGDIDKIMLARLSTLGATGIYAAASRAVALAFVPIFSVLQATYYRFFAHGAAGLAGTVAFARRLVLPFVTVGVVAGVGIWVLAPLAPAILGNDFSGSVEALRWLAVVPLLQSLYYLAGDTLTGAGFQRARSILQVSIAALNILLNLYLIPRYSWRGAAFATIACDVALIAALWGTVARLSHRPVEVEA